MLWRAEKEPDNIVRSEICQTQGQESNLSGKFLEEMVSLEFKKRGILCRPWGDDDDNCDMLNRRRLLTNAAYTSIYGCHAHSEFLYIDDERGLSIRIECRWQQSSGSVDEKFPYLLENARRKMPEDIVWLVVDGGGARKEALAWIKREAAATKHKRISVFNMAETRKAIKSLVERGAAA